MEVDLFGEDHRLLSDHAPQQVFFLVVPFDWNHDVVSFSALLLDQTHEKGKLVVSLLDEQLQPLDFLGRP